MECGISSRPSVKHPPIMHPIPACKTAPNIVREGDMCRWRNRCSKRVERRVEIAFAVTGAIRYAVVCMIAPRAPHCILAKQARDLLVSSRRGQKKNGTRCRTVLGNRAVASPFCAPKAIRVRPKPFGNCRGQPVRSHRCTTALLDQNRFWRSKQISFNDFNGHGGV
jgi:hypothetical protein